MLSSPARRCAHLRDECTVRALRLTKQRDVLLHVLSSTIGHPTADDLFQKVLLYGMCGRCR